MTPCVINLRRHADARSPIIVADGTKILEQVLTNDSSCDFDSINAEDILGEIVIREHQQELGGGAGSKCDDGSGEHVLFGSQSAWRHNYTQHNHSVGREEEFKLDEVKLRLADQYQCKQFQNL